MFAEALASILRDHCTPADVRAIEAGGSHAALLAAIGDAGFLELLAAEEEGGAGASLSDFHPVLALCGAHAVPLPLAQTFGARLLAPREALPDGLITFAPGLVRDADGALHAALVPCALVAAHVIAADGDALRLLPVAGARRVPTGVHGSLAASLHWPAGAGRPLPSSAAAGLQPLAAALHAGLLAGAMKHVFDMTLAYGNERVQFGKSIGKFQAVQHQLSVMAEHVAAGCIAAEAAFQGAARIPADAACAVAKARTSEAAQLVASIAHALHGAIGITQEYDLQLYTRRLHEWRMAHGSETHWNRVLGRLLIDSPHTLAADFVRAIGTAGTTPTSTSP
ncbi:Acyl-CoA dehydrogenase (plasmid) [Variovorax sp. SRS16]|uniref:acyl-CoA dehydrogenase family protein n=1 Tax=Variovorax sp. SRS16 TaxID=282217 RepID=UPI0013165114|nr:acyl-CoA dehydrogenase family protein [Variovorax sp. SRS16]VTU45766.1 Acyl-CoA dehydrogenase [Variovorax sp. SRS16]